MTLDRAHETQARLRRLQQVRTAHRATLVGIEAAKKRQKALADEIEALGQELCRLGDPTDDLAGMQALPDAHTEGDGHVG